MAPSNAKSWLRHWYWAYGCSVIEGHAHSGESPGSHHSCLLCWFVVTTALSKLIGVSITYIWHVRCCHYVNLLLTPLALMLTFSRLIYLECQTQDRLVLENDEGISMYTVSVCHYWVSRFEHCVLVWYVGCSWCRCEYAGYVHASAGVRAWSNHSRCRRCYNHYIYYHYHS